MAIIQNSEVIQKLVDELGLSPALEKVPTELAEKILPVFQINADEIITKPEGIIRYMIDSALNDQDKTFVVPSGKKWEILQFVAKYTSDGNAGDRYLSFQVYDSDANLMFNVSSASEGTQKQIASKIYVYTWREGIEKAVVHLTADGANFLGFQMPLPMKPLILLSGWYLRVQEGSGTSATDDMENYLLVNESDDNSTG